MDATCPYVLRIHDIVDKNTADAKLCVIMGDKAHPEVVGTKSYSHCEAVVCSDEQELLDIVNEKLTNNEEKFVLTSQTTYNNEKYVNCQKVAEKLYTNAKIFDTICCVTETRQQEAEFLCSYRQAYRPLVPRNAQRAEEGCMAEQKSVDQQHAGCSCLCCCGQHFPLCV